MKNIDPTLLAFLDSGTQFCVADLYTLTISTGQVFRYTSCDQNIQFSGKSWASVGTLFSRDSIKSSVGIEVDTLKVTVNPGPELNINTVPFAQAAWEGAFDGASLRLERLFLSDWKTPVGTVLLFLGQISNIETSSTAVILNVTSQVEYLNIQMPRNIYQAPCVHVLYDQGCGINKSAFTISGVAGNQNLDGSVPTNVSAPDAYYNRGGIKWTSGPNNGVVRTIKSWTSNTMTFFSELPTNAKSGDQFIIYPGCDKTFTGDCKNKYNNVIHFKGYPFIPVPETAV